MFVWDTAGSERYQALNRSYYKDTDGVLFCFDVTEKSSFDKVQDFWLDELAEHAPPTAVKMLIGNKADLS